MADFRKSDSEALKEKLQPDATKSDSAKFQQNVTGMADTAASYLPGQHKTSDHLNSNTYDKPIGHDEGRRGPIDQLQSALTPESSKTLGDKAQEKYDHGASAIKPESNKTLGQKVMDTVNPNAYGSTVNEDGQHTGQKPDIVQQVKDGISNLTGANKPTTADATHTQTY